MRLRNSPQRWGAIAQTLHWGLAVLIVAMFPLGWYMVALDLGPRQFQLYSWHKSLGLTVFALMLLRLAWYLGNPAPAPPAHMPLWERRGMHAGHALLYVIVLAMTITGYVINDAANFPLAVYGWFTLPGVIDENRALEDLAIVVHANLGWAVLVVLAVHVAAALRHHFILHDDILRRMLPVRPRDD